MSLAHAVNHAWNIFTPMIDELKDFFPRFWGEGLPLGHALGTVCVRHTGIPDMNQKRVFMGTSYQKQ